MRAPTLEAAVLGTVVTNVAAAIVTNVAAAIVTNVATAAQAPPAPSVAPGARSTPGDGEEFPCVQYLTFLGITDGTPPVAWLTEDIAGACSFSNLVQIALGPDSVTVLVTPNDVFNEWGWLARGFATLRPREITLPRPHPVVDAPALRPELYAAFLAHIEAGGSDGVTWNAEHGAAGVHTPVIDGKETSLAYFYPHGLYVNYDVLSAKPLGEGRWLVLTSQPALGESRNTMHGFLVVRATEPAGTASGK